MVFRKPYAFLIKNFKKINLALLVLSFFIYYKVLNLSSFVNDYISNGNYNKYVNPISHYTSFFSYIIFIVIILILIVVVYLLKKKKKPSLSYSLVIIEYVFLFIIFMITNNYFNNVGENLVSTVGIRAIKDFLLIGNICQYPVLILYIIRLLGIDLNKFGFLEDEEFLLINEDDREEVELSLEFDKDSIKRNFNRLKRNIKYFYEEHKKICKLIAFIILFIIAIDVLYTNLVLNKSYKQGQTLNANGYSITINNSYLTNYDKSGNELNKNKSYIILDVSVTNNNATRIMDVERFIISDKKALKKNIYYFPTLKLNNYFEDLGKGFNKQKFENNKKYNFILIYEIERKKVNDNYTLYYSQSRGYNDVYLRKIKLNMKKTINELDINKYYLEDEMKYQVNNEDKTFAITNYEINKEFSYYYKNCTKEGICSILPGVVKSQNNYLLLKIDIDSEDYTGLQFIDFLNDYGKINYRVNNKNNVYKIKNAIEGKYKGLSVYLKVPKEIEKSNNLYISIKIRNNNYNYYLIKGESNG